MEELGNAYAEMYAHDGQVDLHVEERRRVVALLNNKLSDEERRVLDKCPDLEELEVVVK